MTCIKTGCNAYIEPYGEYVHGDAFQTDNNTLYLRITSRTRTRPTGEKLHFNIENYEDWFDKSLAGTPSTMIVSEDCYENYGYEGKEI